MRIHFHLRWNTFDLMLKVAAVRWNESSTFDHKSHGEFKQKMKNFAWTHRRYVTLGILMWFNFWFIPLHHIHYSKIIYVFISFSLKIVFDIILIYHFSKTGGPAVFVISWAIIKAFTVEPQNVDIDGVSVFQWMLPAAYCIITLVNLVYCLLMGADVSGTLLLLFEEWLAGI